MAAWSLLTNYKLVSSACAACILQCTLIISCFVKAVDSGEAVSNLAVMVLANSLGWLVGIFIAPYNAAEKTTFAQYAGAISAFLSGYVLAKVDPLVTHFLSVEHATSIADIHVFRMMVFSSAFLISLIITFVFRKYA